LVGHSSMSSVAGAGRRLTSHLVALVSVLRPMTGLGPMHALSSTLKLMRGSGGAR
jgi:hypothetical protein